MKRITTDRSIYKPDRDRIAPTYPKAGKARDLTSRTGAEMLAAEIEAWWAKRDYRQVRAWVDEHSINGDHGHAVYSVRTNLIGGMPPKI